MSSTFDPDLLALYGWTDRVLAAWQSWLDDAGDDVHHAQPARVVRVDRGLVTVVAPYGEERLPVAGRLRHRLQGAVAVGDWVAVCGGAIVGCLDRRTSLRRRDTDGSSGSQVVVANIDAVLVVIPLTESVRMRRLERFLAFARSSGAEPLLALTKCDLWPDLAEAVRRTRAVTGGVPVHAVSALTGEGIDELRQRLLPGESVALVGPSGAGKSTLVNALGADHELSTGVIRNDGKGRHTTTAREMVRLGNGALMIDTPGLRALALWDAEEGVASTYADVIELASRCRFRNCSHTSEPGCAVNAAVADGVLEGERVDGLSKLQREQQRLEAKVDGRLRAERNRELRKVHRALRDQPSR